MKIALLPGHARKEDGATVCAGYYKDFGEWALARTYLPGLAEELRELKHSVVLTEREEAGGTSPSYSARAANETGADIALEWHFNDYKGAEGCEVLYYAEVDNPKGREFAQVLSNRIALLLGVRDRGAKPIRSSADRGWNAFKKSLMPFFMIEPCFAGSNEDEARAFGALIKSGVWKKRVAKIVSETINEVYNHGLAE